MTIKCEIDGCKNKAMIKEIAVPFGGRWKMRICNKHERMFYNSISISD